MSRPRVLICGNLVWAHDDVKQMFSDLADVIVMDSPDRADFMAQLKQGGKYHGIVGIYRHNVSADHIGVFDSEIVNALDGVKWIAHNGAGYDQIDVAACKAKGITVSNTPGAVDDGTATTAMYLLIATCRQFTKAERNLREGKWKAGLKPAHDPSALTLSILGLGGIGMRFAELAHAFPMRILYHSRSPVSGAPDWCEYYPKERLGEMLAETDVLSVHVPLRSDTVGFVGEKEIRGLKKGAIIINTARGKVVDEAAMIRALEDGHLSSVGLDVYPDEPEVNPRWLEFPQVTLLPHMGTETQESQHSMEVRALTNLRDFLTKGTGNDVVPEHRSKL